MSSGYRGSAAKDASDYKKAGHTNEDDFGVLAGGGKVGLLAQGKTDWKDSQGRTFSIKRGLDPATKKWTKHWQVFLYGLNRLKSDGGFLKLGQQGKLLQGLLESFPEDFEIYSQDKLAIKETLASLPKSLKGTKRVEAVAASITGINEYYDSKIRLSKVTYELSQELEIESNRSDFLRKAFFNGPEVEYLAINENGTFVIYSQDDVVTIMTSALKPSLSNAGARSDDLNIPGQKVVFKAAANVAELEVRNEQNHYRELRFNVHAKRASDLLRSKTVEIKREDGRSWREIPKN
jgi:hypothetical protein